MILHPITPRNSRFSLRSLSARRRSAGHRLGRRLDDGYHYFRKVTPAGTAEIETIVVGRADVDHPARRPARPLQEAQRALVSLEPLDRLVDPLGRAAGERGAAGGASPGAVPRARHPAVRGRGGTAGPEPGMAVSWERDQAPGIHIEGDLERLASRRPRRGADAGPGRPDRRPARSAAAASSPGDLQPPRRSPQQLTGPGPEPQLQRRGCPCAARGLPYDPAPMTATERAPTVAGLILRGNAAAATIAAGACGLARRLVRTGPGDSSSGRCCSWSRAGWRWPG